MAAPPATTPGALAPEATDRAGLPRGAVARGAGLARREAFWGLLFVAPAILLFAVFSVFPVLWTFAISLTLYSVAVAPKWAGLDNYALLLRDPLFWKALVNTVVFIAGTVPPHIALSLGLALLLNLPLRGRAILRSTYYLPGVTSVVAASLIWLSIYNPQTGLLNGLLGALHLPKHQWLQDPDLAMPSIIAMSIWQGLGGGMLIFLAGLQGIPQLYYDAAAIDGAGAWSRFRHITWPLLQPTTFFVLVTSCIGAFQVFQQPWIMTQGGPLNRTLTLVMSIYLNGFQFGRMGYASALAVVLFLLILGLSVVNLRLFSRDVEY